MVMENNNSSDPKKDNPYTPVNPFTNQAMPPNPAPLPFNPPGQIKPPPPPQPGEVKSARPASKTDSKIIFLYILLIAVGAVAAKYAFDFFVPKSQSAGNKKSIGPLIKITPNKKQDASSAGVPGAQKKDQPLISLKKKTVQSANPYTLSGIFASGDSNYCIINDKVAGEGDLVDGAKVIQISNEEVELQTNERTFRINLRNK